MLAPEPEPSAPQPSILIVEDERIVALDLQKSLEDIGYGVSGVADSSIEALRLVAEDCPDLVLMDVRLRGPLDGIETAESLRELFGVPIVYLTAHSDEAT